MDVIIERTETGFSAYSEDKEHKFLAVTTGNTIEEIEKNIVESINLCYEAAGINKVVTLQDIKLIHNVQL